MIVLYRKGSTHKIEGVTCEVGRFPVSQLHARLDDGWVNDPRNIDVEEKWEETSGPEVESEPETGATVAEEPVTSTGEAPAPTEEHSEEAIRQAAKAAGIKSWHNMGLDKLKAKLAEVTG